MSAANRAFWPGSPVTPRDGGLPDAPEAYGDGLEHVRPRRDFGEAIIFAAEPARLARAKRAQRVALGIALVLLGMVLGSLPQLAGRASPHALPDLCTLSEIRR